MDLRVAGFALALSILTGIAFGLAPAWIGSSAAMGAGTARRRPQHAGTRGRLRAWLVAAEVALCVVLLAGAGLLFRSLAGLQSVDPGLNPSGVLIFRISLSRGPLPGNAAPH